MIRLVVLVYPQHLWVLAQESPGTAKRLVGDPWADDGAMPLLLARIGRERYIGTTAECVAYESPRAELEPVLGAEGGVDNTIDRAAAFLTLLDEAVRRRFPQDDLSWRFAVAARVPADAAATLSAACWLAGLGAACVDRLPALPPLPPLPPAPGPAAAVHLFGLLDGEHAVAALACPSGAGGAALAVLEVMREAQPPAAGADPAPQHPRSLHLRHWQRAALESTAAPGLVALPGAGRWELKALDPAAARSARRQLSDALERVMVRAEAALAQQAALRLAFVEWGDSPLAWAAGQGLRQRPGCTVGTLRLEDLPGLFDAPAATLRHTLAFALEPAASGHSDDKIVASRGAALPLRSEHIVHLRRSGQRSLPFELHALDDSTGKAYRLAAGALPLPTEARAQTPVHLAVACHACGAIELRFEVPAWHFQETVLIDTAGRPHLDAGRRALQTTG